VTTTDHCAPRTQAQEGDTLVAIGQRVILDQVPAQHSGFGLEGGVRLDFTEPGSRSVERRIGKVEERQPTGYWARRSRMSRCSSIVRRKRARNSSSLRRPSIRWVARAGTL
jgi:hypothetical protein